MSIEIDPPLAKAIVIVLEGLEEISRKLTAADVGEYHLDDGLRLSIDGHPQWEFRLPEVGSDWFVAIPHGGES